MKAYALQLVLAVIGLSIAGCSKHSEPPADQTSPAGQIVADRGVLDVPSGDTSSWDVILKDDSVLVIQLFVITSQIQHQMVVSGGMITMRGRPIVIFNAQTNSPGQATFFTGGRYLIKFKSHIVPPHKYEGPPPNYLSNKRSRPLADCRARGAQSKGKHILFT